MNQKLIMDNIEFLHEYLPKLISSIKNTVDMFIQNKETEVFDLLPQIVDGLDWSIRSIISLEKLGYVKDLRIEEMKSNLKLIEQSLHKTDYVITADIFEYEIIEILEGWYKQINSFKGDM